MIDELSIRDLGVIGEARLPLGPGFTAITGETGAGKTMVVTALGLLLGERADSGAVRSGSDRAVVEGRWLVDPTGPVAERVRDAGGELDGEELILARSISSEGRSRATVGGRSAPAGVLVELAERLVVVHGQSDQVRLRSTSAQREALDRFAGPELAELLDDYRATFHRWQAGQGELDVLVAEQERRAREAAELREALAEIEAAAPRLGEDVELAEFAERLGNLEELRLAAASAHELISSETPSDTASGGDVLERLDAARRALERVVPHDAALAPVAEAITTATQAAVDAATELAGYLAGLDGETVRELEAVQERRAVLAALARRHGPTLADVIDRLQEGGARLLELDSDEDRIEALQARVGADRERVIALAERLSGIRGAAAERLAAAVSDELEALAMAGARLIVEVSDRPEYSASGKDQVQLLLLPHAGAEPRPVARGASGGELSRVMLAIEVVLAASDPVPTFVFDEVDAGVGGAAAIEIGRRLARLSSQAQVIVVTHLAQVAAFAGNHLRVSKDGDGAVTASSVAPLGGQERVAEMARLLSGLPDSASGLAHARELLELAGGTAG
ncbi:MAG: DNA repair protein RecN [Microbacteriaceae bacterium]